MRPREYFLTTADRELWEKFLPVRNSVYGSVGYALVVERLLNHVTRLHVVESDTAWISYPMQLRPISQLPFASKIETRCDIRTPEFTGPHVFGRDDTLVRHYLDFRRALAEREEFVAEFAHLHPWSGGEALLQDGSTLDRHIIWCDATLEPEFLRRNHLEHRRRKCLGKAEREGVSVVEAGSTGEIRDFVRIYQGTMNRNNAQESYYFSEEYFLSFRLLLPSNSRFTLTIFRGQVIGALFVLFDDENVFAYLGGSDASFHHLSPASFQIWESICWAHRTGRKRVILGGGYVANDGIFKFKRSFSPLMRPFYTYRKVHRPKDYVQLETAGRIFYELGNDTVSFFPSYRYTPGPGAKSGSDAPIAAAVAANE